MSSLNRCEFIGNLGKDPEVRYAPSGSAIASFSVACTESWKDKETGQKQERTEWVRCTAFGKLAEIIEKYLSKGSKVYVAGKMKTDKWQDQEGKDRYSTGVIVNEMVMLGGVQDSGASINNEQTTSNQPQASGDNMSDSFDDNVPF